MVELMSSSHELSCLDCKITYYFANMTIKREPQDKQLEFIYKHTSHNHVGHNLVAWSSDYASIEQGDLWVDHPWYSLVEMQKEPDNFRIIQGISEFCEWDLLDDRWIKPPSDSHALAVVTPAADKVHGDTSG